MSEDINIDIEFLISSVQTRPVLWDKTEVNYKDRNATRKAWHDVCIELKEDFGDLGDYEKNTFGKEVIRRWTNVRDAYAKSCKKDKEIRKSGGAAFKRKKYVYNDQLKFLSKIYHAGQTKESFDSVAANDRERECDINFDTRTASTDESVVNPQTSHEKTGRSTTKLGPRKRRKPEDFESKFLNALEEQKPNRHLSFFKGIIPSLEKFDEDEVLQFQMGVLQLISNINQRKRIVMSSHPSSMPLSNFLSPLQQLHSTQEVTMPPYVHIPTAALYPNFTQSSTLTSPGFYPSEKPSPTQFTSSSCDSLNFA